ncbi:MAG: V-type ATP synthase subunit E [Clostridiales bacterium]
MNGIDKINERILSEGKKIANNTIEDANKEVKKIISEALELAKEKKESIIAEAEKEAKLTENRIISGANMDSKKDLLVAKQSLIDESFEDALKKMCDFGLDRYQKILEQLILNSVETGNESIILNERDKKRFKNSFIVNINKKLKSSGKNGEIKISDKSADIKAGVIISQNDIEINCSFESLIRMKKETIEPEIYNIFFNKSEDLDGSKKEYSYS